MNSTLIPRLGHPRDFKPMNLFSTMSILPIPRPQAQILVKARMSLQKQFQKEESKLGWDIVLGKGDFEE